jgi:hypothetical protein
MLLIHSSKIPEEYLKELHRLIPRLECFALSEDKGVYPSISSHPDIFLCQLAEDLIVHSPKISKELLEKLKGRSIEAIRSKKHPRGKYPHTAVLNAASIGKSLVHRLDICDEEIKAAASKRGIRLIDCDQGYARCSVIPVKEDTLITSDPGIASAAKAVGIEALRIITGNIVLPGETYGFIGGTTGILPGGEILFLGDIRMHPDFRIIDEFLKKRGAPYLYIAGLPLYDAGSLIFIN